ncbi:amidohydrolase [Paenibacillus sp. NEAU-GSW1]|uniref:amidohydrolase family protein n=1 Tax=Paenibacillus sp. NEAU-GSW1 TaxID=2682486 RepID=UPI0015669A0E|nr:amidohydrolase family protein [Paenibacillus sp. NEAU-GSW1]
MRIDSHQHYWSIARGDYGWITPEIPVLYRDYLPVDLAPSLAKHGIDKTVAVQAAPTLAETDYLLALSDKDDSIAAVVGWLDLDDPDYWQHFERMRKHPKLAGFRMMIQELPDPNAVLEPHFVKALQRFEEENIPVDLLVVSHQLDTVIKLLELVPNLRGVIDHIAKPRIAEGVLDPWRDQMAEIAKHKSIYCKLSGMVTEADHQHWQPEDFSRYIRFVLEHFGPERVMFGSDWPVCLLAASYDEVIGVLEDSIPFDWSGADRDRLYGLNAKEFYKL